MKARFFLCTTCGNVAVKLFDSGQKLSCCGKEMIELTPNTYEGYGEKHIPVIEKIDKCTCKVKVGSFPHPMTRDHRIVFIFLQTKNGGQIQYLDPDGEPEAVFCGCEDKPVAVYAYCDIHGLWKLEL